MSTQEKNTNVILITEPDEIARDVIPLLKAQGFTVLFLSDERDNENIQGLFVRTYTNVTKDYLEQFPNLTFILRAGVGLDTIDLEECKRRNISVYNAPGSNANAVAEYVVTTMLMLLRRLPMQMNELRQGSWRNKRYIGEEVQNKVIGLVGCGAIGKLITKKLQNFNVTIWGYDPYVDKETLATFGIKKQELSFILENSDIVSLHLPLTPETKNMFTKKNLSHMKETSFLINTSRGELIHEADLLTLLKKKRIAGAVLDVFINEPNINREFLTLDTVIATPHIAGFTIEANQQMAIGVVENFIHSNVLKNN